MSLNPYLVVGTGRSGTSTVARLLHTNLGVFMGEQFDAPTPSNPMGAYEDKEFKDENGAFIHGLINYPTWQDKIWSVIEKRNKSGREWGLKDPILSYLLGFYLRYFENPRIIRCVRDRELVIKSLMKWYGYDKEHATLFWHSREKALDRFLAEKKHLVIDFGRETLDEEAIMQTIARRFCRPRKVYFALLNKGWIRREHAWRTIPDFLHAPNIDVIWENPNMSWANPIFGNRNAIARRFLETDCDFLLMLDDDVIPYHNVLEYVYADADVIGFPAKVRQEAYNVNWVAYAKPKGFKKDFYFPVDFSKIDQDADLIKVDIVGTGCILIRRKVIEVLFEKAAKQGWDAPFTIELDESGVSRYGTDFAFCRRAKKAGFTIFVAPKMTCEHIKEVGLLNTMAYDDSDNRDESSGRYNMPWGAWAITQKDWHFIKGVIEEVKPKRILEFGTGLSSLLMSEMAEVVSYETDKGYAGKVRRRKKPDNKLTIKIWNGKTIKGKQPSGFDFSFIDGPKGEPSGGIGRQHSIKIASEICNHIIVHDANRMHEKRWQDMYLRGKFSLVRRNGFHQTGCAYWKRKDGDS